jgi:23S rRNA pseudouridine2605 synthase
MADGVRVQKVLAEAGVASRREAEKLIVAGRVTADGSPARLGQRVDPAAVRLTVDGRPVRLGQPRVHLALHKPAGVTSTVRDRHATRTVVELVPSRLRTAGARLYPVGRLDRDSEGLILLTNDGGWAARLLHPRHGVEREYAVALATPLSAEQRRRLERGIRLEEGIARLERLRRLKADELARLAASLEGGTGQLAWYSLVLRQGWKRQVRRMFSAVEARVVRLVRVRFGSLALAGMRPGEMRELTEEEAAELTAGEPPTVFAPAVARPSMGRALVVAIDGPGGSGKSTVGAEVALRMGYRFCDTGVLYRGLTLLAVDLRVDVDDAEALLSLVPRVELLPDGRGRYVRLRADGADVTDRLHSGEVDRHVSQVSRHAPVRAALLPIQRALAAGGRIIMAGRDIGSVVLPDADLKIYLDVSLAERSRRRAAERGVAGDEVAEARIEDELRRRDGIDTSREAAPLRVPEGAHVVATEGNTFEQTVQQVLELVRQAAGA